MVRAFDCREHFKCMSLSGKVSAKQIYYCCNSLADVTRVKSLTSSFHSLFSGHNAQLKTSLQCPKHRMLTKNLLSGEKVTIYKEELGPGPMSRRCSVVSTPSRDEHQDMMGGSVH